VSFFRSRWVNPPANAQEAEPTSLPGGFRAAGVAAGLKPEGLDVGVLLSDEPETVSAARFTTNARLGAPVIVSKASATERLRVVVANSGGSNTGDGERGIETARATQRLAAELLGVEPAQVGVASTGVIGTALPREKLLDGVRKAADQLGPDSAALSEAIVTTDRSPKHACLDVTMPSGGGKIRLAGQAKGAGMISPRFATMFCFVQTDAQLDQATLDLLTGVCVKRSFDRISVDGQLSTSDTVFALANGASGVRVEPETSDELTLGEAMDALMRQLALEIVADGEGAARVGRVVVRGGVDDVERVARAVADSPLVKTALHGGDPNFGRIVQAAGAAYAGDGYGETFPVDLDIEGKPVISGGVAVDLDQDDWTALEQAVTQPEVEYELTVPGEGGETEMFFSDLSCDYVTLNAEYTS
jgi:glutamate N-acetyltransferase / amino-acid N-acetyltransferase